MTNANVTTATAIKETTIQVGVLLGDRIGARRERDRFAIGMRIAPEYETRLTSEVRRAWISITSFNRRRAEGLSDRDITRCLNRHIANEIFALLTHPAPASLTGQLLRQQRQELDIPITDVAQALQVPYQRLRRLEIGQRTDPELEQRCQQWLDDTRQRKRSQPLDTDRSIHSRGRNQWDPAKRVGPR